MTNCKVVAALVGLGLALPVVALAQDQPLEEQLVNAMNKVFGVHPGFRANHAKGIVVEGGPVQRRHDPSDGALLGLDGGTEPTGWVRKCQSARHGSEIPSAGRQRHRYCDQFF